MKNVIEQEIENVNAEIKHFEKYRDRLVAMLHRSQAEEVSVEPKKRGRKKKPGLPSATPPASEANHV